MSLQRRQAGLVRRQVVETGSAVLLELPDGPGYYILRRVSCQRIAGAAAASFLPVLSEQAPATAANTVFTLASAVVLPASLTWPPPGLELGEPARYGLFEDGQLRYAVGADVLGDTYELAVIIERIR